jgi:hypothetical protein
MYRFGRIAPHSEAEGNTLRANRVLLYMSELVFLNVVVKYIVVANNWTDE